MGPGPLTRAALPLLLFYQSSWSFEGRQALGFRLVLAALARDPEERRALLAAFRHPSNTNPYLAGLFTGALVHEYRVDPAGAAHLEHAFETSLAAQGDSLFWQALRPFWSGLAVLAGLAGVSWAPWLFLAGFNACTFLSRVGGLAVGGALGRIGVRRVADVLPRLTQIVEGGGAFLVGALAVPAIFVRTPFWWSLPAFALAIPWRLTQRSPGLLFLLYLLAAGLLTVLR